MKAKLGHRFGLFSSLAGFSAVVFTACSPSQQVGLSESANGGGTSVSRDHVVISSSEVADDSSSENKTDNTATAVIDHGNGNPDFTVPDINVTLDPDSNLVISFDNNSIKDILTKAGGCAVTDCDPLQKFDFGISESILEQLLSQPIDGMGIVSVPAKELIAAAKAGTAVVINTSSGPFLPDADPSEALAPVTVVQLGKDIVGSISTVEVGTNEIAYLGKLTTGSFAGFVVDQTKGTVSSVVTQSVPVLQLTRVTSSMATNGGTLASRAGSLLVVTAKSSVNLAPSAVKLATPLTGTAVSTGTLSGLNLNSVSNLTGLNLNLVTGQLKLGF